MCYLNQNKRKCTFSICFFLSSLPCPWHGFPVKILCLRSLLLSHCLFKAEEIAYFPVFVWFVAKILATNCNCVSLAKTKLIELNWVFCSKPHSVSSLSTRLWLSVLSWVDQTWLVAQWLKCPKYQSDFSKEASSPFIIYRLFIFR